MPEETPSASINRELAAKIVGRVCSAKPNRVRPTRDPDLDRSSGTRGSWQTRSRSRAASEPPPCRSGDPFIAIMSSAWIAAGAGRCSGGHIAGHGLSVEQYRARWSLRPDHPITAPGYSERRSTMANSLDFGRLG